MAGSSSPAKWTQEDEWALSLLMQKRMNADTTGSFGPPSLPERSALQAAGAMHDGSKRRLVADSEPVSEWEQVNAESAPTYAGKVRLDDTAFEEALVAALDASPVIGAASQLEKEADSELPVDLPPGVDKGKHCFWDYKKWVRTHIKPGTSKGAALDFAAYLRAYGKEHGRSQLPVFPGTSIPGSTRMHECIIYEPGSARILKAAGTWTTWNCTSAQKGV